MAWLRLVLVLGLIFCTAHASVSDGTVEASDSESKNHASEHESLGLKAGRGTVPVGGQTQRDLPELAAPKSGLAGHVDVEDPITTTTQMPLSSQAVIHFMFLAVADVPHASIWKQFFTKAPKINWRVWLHCENAESCQKGRFAEQVPRVVLVPTVHLTQSFGFIKAAVRLAKIALLQRTAPRGAIEKFVLISDSTLPIKPFSVVYKELTHDDQSDFCIYPQWEWAYTAVDDRQIYLPRHHRWVTLNRAHARELVTNWERGARGIQSDEEGRQWNVSLRSSNSSSRGSLQNISWHNFTRKIQQRCPEDDELIFATIFGPLDESSTLEWDIPGLGKLSSVSPYSQGRCRTLAITSSTDPILQEMQLDPEARIAQPSRSEESKIMSFVELGVDSMSTMRRVPHLFARKFVPEAELPWKSGIKKQHTFADILFNETVPAAPTRMMDSVVEWLWFSLLASVLVAVCWGCHAVRRQHRAREDLSTTEDAESLICPCEKAQPSRSFCAGSFPMKAGLALMLFLLMGSLVAWKMQQAPRKLEPPLGPLMIAPPPLMHDFSSGADLHFMFLAMSDVPHATLWRAFFDTAPVGSYTVWLHCKYRAACLAGTWMQLLPETQLVPSLETTYCTDLVTAHMQLLRFALEGTSAPKEHNEKFVLMSDSTLPVKPFSIIHQSLTKHRESDLCIYPASNWHRTAELPGDKTAYIVEHSQFNQLNRKDAKALVDAWDLPSGGPPWLGVPTQEWVNETSSDWKLHDRPAWDVRLLEPGTSVDHAKRMSLARFRGPPTCADEEAAFSMLYGAPVFNDESHDVEVPGFGKLAFDRNSNQGRCATYFSFYYASVDNWVLEREFAADPPSQVYVTRSGDQASHPVSFGNLSVWAVHKLRTSPWLFARKFHPDATLSGYQEHILRSSCCCCLRVPVLLWWFVALRAIEILHDANF